jgi:hypothetical protein
MGRHAATAAVSVAVALALAGCGSSGSTRAADPAADATRSATQTPGTRPSSVPTPPPRTRSGASAEEITRDVVDDIRRHDWADLYAHTPSHGFSEEEFTRIWEHGNTRIRTIELTGQTAYRTDGSTRYAQTPVHVTATVAGTPREWRGVVRLISYRDTWAFTGIEAAAG